MKTEIYAAVVLSNIMIVALAFRLFAATWGRDLLPDLRAYGGFGPWLLLLGIVIGSTLFYMLKAHDVI